MAGLSFCDGRVVVCCALFPGGLPREPRGKPRHPSSGAPAAGGRGAVDVLRNWIKSNRGLLVLLLGSGIFRTAVADWNSIPSGFMQPALQEGKWCSSIG